MCCAHGTLYWEIFVQSVDESRDHLPPLVPKDVVAAATVGPSSPASEPPDVWQSGLCGSFLLFFLLCCVFSYQGSCLFCFMLIVEGDEPSGPVRHSLSSTRRVLMPSPSHYTKVLLPLFLYFILCASVFFSCSSSWVGLVSICAAARTHLPAVAAVPVGVMKNPCGPLPHGIASTLRTKYRISTAFPFGGRNVTCDSLTRACHQVRCHCF